MLLLTFEIPKAPNFVWKTTDFPRATKGYTWSIVLQVLLSESAQAFNCVLSGVHECLWNYSDVDKQSW